MAAPAAQSLTFHDDGSYRFYYETGKEGGSHTRTEIRNPDGVVIGKFSFEDPDGELREVNYRADESGFVAQGDVGVKGAPKGQFPVAQENQPTQQTEPTAMIVDIQPAEPKQEIDPQQKSEDIRDQPLADATDDDSSYHDEEQDKADIQDLALEESSANDPPEAFPPGFFLEKFHGLRRLPEPTKEDKPATTEAPKEAGDEAQTEKVEEAKNDKKEATETTALGAAPIDGSVFSFAPLKPFPAPGISNNPNTGIPQLSHQEWSSSMFHQPVYVFAYNHPDSYGYHYYF